MQNMMLQPLRISEAESKAKDQQCIGRHILEVSELAKNFTACSVVVSCR